ncbi:MAG: PQQ-binding-like beta-propeller repeat protein [Anaerohalosphaeraceae bacterium]
MEYIDNSQIKMRPLYQGLMGCSVVATALGVVAAVLLAVAGYQIRVTDPAQAEMLQKMKEQLQTRSSDEALAGQIRDLDALVRRNELRRQQFIHTGTIYLAGSIIVAAVCFIAARSMLKPAPVVPTADTCPAEQIQRARQTRLAVTVTLAVLGAVGLYEALMARPKQAESQSAVKPQPAETVDWAEAVAQQWPSFRGPWGDGVCRMPDIPAVWNEKENKGIVWKSEVPLHGFSSPIVWGDRVYLTGATAEEQKLFCYDAKDGKLLWTGQIKPDGTAGREVPEIMEQTGYAANTPATNGNYVCAIFATGDIGCFDKDGKVQWQKALGIPESAYGYAASLAVFEDKVIVQFDQGSEEGLSEILAIHITDGAIVWRTKRPTHNTWTSPTMVKTDKGYQILTSGSPWVMGYDPATGQELWKASCLGSDIAPTQILAAGLVVALQPYDKLYAFRLDNAGGDVTESAKAWEGPGDMPDVASPVSDGKLVWTLTVSGGLSCFDLADGKEVYTQSLDLECHASPALVGDKLYILGQNGQMIIAQAGRTYQEVGRSAIDEECYASPAFAPGRIFLRSTQSLYCIGKVD